MELTASDIYELYRPSRCNLRPRLMRLNGAPGGPSDPLAELVREMGKRHEEQSLRTFDAYVDLSGTIEEPSLRRRREETRAAIGRRADVLYQPVLFGWRNIGAQDEDFLVGIPDLLIREGDGYVVCDCKLTTNANDQMHQEILRQVELYGWLYEQEFGIPPLRLEVILGDGSVQQLPYDGGTKVLAVLDEIKAVVALPSDPYEPVGRSKCDGCAFHPLCWTRAEKTRDVSLLPGVTQRVARQLNDRGSGNYLQLSEAYSVETLVQIPGIGKNTAMNILRHAESHRAGSPLQINQFPYGIDRACVVFDLEGIPQYFGNLARVYLWGFQMFGPAPRPYYPVIGPPGDPGDYLGWYAFLTAAEAIFAEYGDLNFIHYGTYEKSMLHQYVRRYGDVRGIARRILGNLLDLYPIVLQTVVLPDSGYGLKVVERWAGFRRTHDDYGGSWSIATYIRAVELRDDTTYRMAMEKIVTYNREDVEATWAVYEWMANNFANWDHPKSLN